MEYPKRGGVSKRSFEVRPVRVSFVGVLKMTEGNQLHCVDERQWRLYGPLQIPAPRCEEGNSHYQVHLPLVLQ